MPADGAYLPFRHFEHIDAPATEYSPGLQVLLHDGCPSRLLLVPGEQGVHSVDPAAEYEPTAHLMHSGCPDASLFFPAVHCGQEVDPAAEDVPGKQISHFVGLDAESPLYPALHLKSQGTPAVGLVPGTNSVFAIDGLLHDVGTQDEPLRMYPELHVNGHSALEYAMVVV